MEIRVASAKDAKTIESLHLRAFPDAENELVAKFALDLLQDHSCLSLVAKHNGHLVGHIAFSPVTITAAPSIKASLLGPLGVDPDCQREGVGKRLIEDGVNRLRAAGIDIVFVYGDPKYYGRFGFDAQPAAPFTPPHTLQFPFGWLALTLNDGKLADIVSPIQCVEALDNPALW